MGIAGTQFSKSSRLTLLILLVAAVMGLTIAAVPAKANAPTRPSAPTSVSVSGVGATSATVNWAAPTSDGGAAITQYSATVRVAGSGLYGRTCTANGAGRSCVVTGLLPGTAYTVAVRAQNSVGWGAQGALSGTFTTAAVTAPSAPTSVSVSGVGATSATVNWAAPTSDGGAAITQYSATVRVSGSGLFAASCATAGAGRSCLVTGLLPGTAYTVDVRAQNSVGWGAQGALSGTFTTAAVTAPSAPTSVSVSGVGATSATVNWAAPTSDGGAAITQYSATVRVSGSGLFAASCATAGAGRSCLVTGLLPGTAYTVDVRAQNSVGWGAQGALSGTFTTVAVAAPSAPTSVSVSGVGATSATVNWAAPTSDGGAAITQYSATVRVSGSGLFAASCTTNGATRSCVVSGLKPGTAYTVAVRAQNSAGWGAQGLLPGTFTTLVS